MAEIKPFRGFTYNTDRIKGALDRVVAPPYDVIPDEMRDELYARSPYNIIRIILGRSLPGDDERNNKYTRAKDFLNKWQDEEILVKDERESFYVYLQEYDLEGKKLSRLGFIALMKIEEYEGSIILPHEHTLAKPKEDRTCLIEQVKGNMSPIFSLFDEDDDRQMMTMLRKITKTSPPFVDIYFDNERNALWRLSEADAIKKIQERMADKKIFIADGHHRYEVARKYREKLKSEKDYDGRADHIMMYFTDIAEPDNLTVMATHRVIKKMDASDDAKLIREFSKFFKVSPCDDLHSLKDKMEESFRRKEGNTFGFFGGGKYLLLISRADRHLGELIEDKRSDEWKALDVAVLHSVVFSKVLSVNGAEGNITYVRDAEKAELMVKDGSHMAAFFMNPTRLDQLKAVAELGEMMPQKSTYFYPKLLTGLVMHKF